MSFRRILPVSIPYLGVDGVFQPGRPKEIPVTQPLPLHLGLEPDSPSTPYTFIGRPRGSPESPRGNLLTEYALPLVYTASLVQRGAEGKARVSSWSFFMATDGRSDEQHYYVSVRDVRAKSNHF